MVTEMSKDNNADSEKSLSAYEIALIEIETGDKDFALWAEAYANTESDDLAKRYYVRKRAEAIDKESEDWWLSDNEGTDEQTTEVPLPNESSKDKQLGKLGILGWFVVIAFYIALWTMQLGELTTLQKAKFYPALLPEEQSAFIWAWILVSLRVFVFLFIHKIISGHSFGKWPVDKKQRPRAFLGIWVGLFSTFLVNSAQNLGLFLYDVNGWMAEESLGFVLINLTTFLLWCIPGLVLASFYKVKVT